MDLRFTIGVVYYHWWHEIGGKWSLQVLAFYGQCPNNYQVQGCFSVRDMLQNRFPMDTHMGWKLGAPQPT